MLDWLNQIDTELFLFLNGLHNSFFDFLMYWISNKYIWIPLYAFFLILIVRKYKWKAVIVLVFVAVLISVSDQISVHLFKDTIMRLRPCHEPELQGLVHLVNNKCGGQHGFISSHATNTFALAGFLSVLLRKSMKYFSLAIFIWASLIAYSRIYLGVHYPADVLVGAIVGIVLGKILSILVLIFINRNKINS